MAPRHQAPRGTRDLLPEETRIWRWAESSAIRILDGYRYGEIRTPMFEDFELFARTSGESSDVVQKEMYRFTDLGQRDLALRPEFTAGVLRAYLERGLGGRTRIHRLWSMGPVFRYGRPQKGRYRQFSQLNCELIGSAAPGADAEVIMLFVDLFHRAWEFPELTVLVNSVGQPASRRAYGDRLREWLAPVQGQLSPDSQVRLELNPLRVLDSKDEGDLAILGGEGWPGGPPEPRPHMLDVLDGEDRAHWDEVLDLLSAAGVRYKIDHGLVRGLDYYTRTAFEVHEPSLGAQSALGGGGRYDGLIEMLGGRATPGVGFAIGLDRVVLAKTGRGDLGGEPAAVYVVTEDSIRTRSYGLVSDIRQCGYQVLVDIETRSFDAQMKDAGKSGARFLVTLRERDWNDGKVTLKDSKTEKVKLVSRDELINELQVHMKPPGVKP